MPQPQAEIKNKTSAPEKNSPAEETKQNSLKPEAQPQEGMGEEEKEEEEKSSLSGVTNLLSPEALLMLGVALIFDVIGWFLLLLNFCGLPVDDFGILEILGFVVFGAWIIFRKFVLGVGTGQAATTQKTQKIIKKVGGKVLKRWGLTFLIELIPFVGSAAPCWLIAVYYEIKNG